MKTRPVTFRTWAPGLLTALLGVACVRLAAPHLDGRGQAALVIIGYLLVPTGLGIIARQIHCRAVNNPEASSDQT